MTPLLAIKIIDAALLLVFSYPALKARIRAGLDKVDEAHAAGTDISQADLDQLDTDIDDLHQQIQRS